MGERERFLVNGINAVEYPACDEVSYPLGIAKCCNPGFLGQAAGIFGRCGSREPEAAIHESLAKTSISIVNKEARFASLAHARLSRLVIQSVQGELLHGIHTSPIADCDRSCSETLSSAHHNFRL